MNKWKNNVEEILWRKVEHVIVISKKIRGIVHSTAA